MSKSPYQTDGKLMTYEQYMKLKKEEQEHLEQKEEEPVKTTKPGRCPVCDGVKFKSRVEPGVWIRTCQTPGCGDEQIF